VTLLAWCTFFAVAPQRRPAVMGLVSFYSGFLVNELPFLALYFLVADTLLAISEGDVASPIGWLAFGLAVLTMAGLALIVWRALRAGPAIDRALHESLGPGWRTALDAESAARLRPRFSVAAVLLRPVLVRRRDVERVANIRYGDAGRRNLLDVYRHRSRPTGCPTLVHLHGGRLVSGRKNREALPLIYRLASQGWVCVSPNYRLSPEVTFPDHLVDIKKVIAWVRAHGREYGADPTVVFVAGGSAGGQLAAMAALSPNDPRFQPGFESVDTSVAAAVSLYGNYDWFGSDWIPASPSEVPPFFAVHGDRDTLRSAESARGFVEELRNIAQHPVVYAELPWAQHEFDMFHSIRSGTVVNAIEAFASWVRATRPTRSRR
jgi:acetyl esterase/lipase